MRLPKECRKRVKRWIKALRSGDYTQGRGNLCRWVKDEGGPDAGHWELCALGVYYDVNAEGEWRTSWPRPDHTELLMEGTSVAYSLAYHGADPCLTRIDTGEVISRNDNSGQTFDQIADWLERECLTKKGAKA